MESILVSARVKAAGHPGAQLRADDHPGNHPHAAAVPAHRADHQGHQAHGYRGQLTLQQTQDLATFGLSCKECTSKLATLQVQSDNKDKQIEDLKGSLKQPRTPQRAALSSSGRWKR